MLDTYAIFDANGTQLTDAMTRVAAESALRLAYTYGEVEDDAHIDVVEDDYEDHDPIPDDVSDMLANVRREVEEEMQSTADSQTVSAGRSWSVGDGA